MPGTGAVETVGLGVIEANNCSEQAVHCAHEVSQDHILILKSICAGAAGAVQAVHSACTAGTVGSGTVGLA